MKPKNLHFFRTIIFTVFAFILSQGTNAFAHAGHAEDVVIRPSTLPHVYAILAPYEEICGYLCTGKTGEGYKAATNVIQAEAKGALKKEKNDTGVQMLRGIVAACDQMLSASTVEEARKGFAALNKQFLPFFKSWQSHLKKHGLDLYVCMDDSEGWLQKHGSAQSPYGNHSSDYNKFKTMD